MTQKELELEAEKYYKENVEEEPLTYETPIHCFIAGATSDAAKYYNILNSAISNNLKGKSKTCKGFIWKYKN